ncbi:LysR family transcriptional regulator [Escherichia coli]|uniref:helix-turn-helix domain-containing protein n=1 Tax=Escherichia coli TaxID=562 RepID=UPI001E603505|nr:LysR family transcriptional regulator [Escherichia coli]MCE3094854.1 LysR family transcriptional regulator [Escherichia coli]
MSHLSHLRTFLEAYRSGSFSKAAELLGITQPAASLDWPPESPDNQYHLFK